MQETFYNQPRSCPVGDSRSAAFLYRQRFGSLSEGSLLLGYDLVVCLTCGAGYADDIPTQEAFDRYYAEMLKYEEIALDGIQREKDLKNHRILTDLLAKYIPPTARLLDIGCATGGLLAECKHRGFTNLHGIDPSLACVQITNRLRGIPAQHLTISSVAQLGEQFDVGCLTGVLEHLVDVDGSLDKVKTSLRPGGLIFLVVPDATRYDHHFSAPFQFFSMEHINYFSPASLHNLLAKHGFSCVISNRLLGYLSPTATEPIIGGLFRWDREENSPFVPERDEETEPALQHYIQLSRDLEQRIHNEIGVLADGGRRLAVWGVGTHTLRLLETSRLRQARIIAFIDSNVHYQGKTLAGIPVIASSAFSDVNAEVLISSQTAEDEIYQLIKQKFCWPNIVHRLYNN